MKIPRNPLAAGACAIVGVVSMMLAGKSIIEGNIEIGVLLLAAGVLLMQSYGDEMEK